MGLSENTLSIFTSDNGGIPYFSSQQPLRGGKGTYYEGGIRVPLVIHWPGKIPAVQSDQPVINIDFYPTILDILDVQPSSDKILDGVSLKPLLMDGQSLLPRPVYWHFPIYLQAIQPHPGNYDSLFRTRPGSVIRMGNWKLHKYYEDGHLELYNLEDNPGETNNLTDSLPDKTNELHRQLIDWMDEVNAPVPTQRNPEYNP